MDERPIVKLFYKLSDLRIIAKLNSQKAKFCQEEEKRLKKEFNEKVAQEHLKMKEKNRQMFKKKLAHEEKNEAKQATLQNYEKQEDKVDQKIFVQSCQLKNQSNQQKIYTNEEKFKLI